MPDPGMLGRAYRMATAGASDHPSEEIWERVVCGELAANAREAVFDHVTCCEECAETFRVLRLLSREARTFDPGVPALELKAVDRSRPLPRGFAVGGLAALAAAAMLLLFLPTKHDHRVKHPEQPAVEILRSGPEAVRPVAVEPVGRVETVNRGFSWQAAQPPETYVVELLNADGEQLWESPEVASTEIDWPSSVPPAAGRYYWRVTALPTEGGERTASTLVAFDLVK